MSSLFCFMEFMGRYHGSKGVPERLVEDGVLGNLAPPGDLEESASHNFAPVLLKSNRDIMRTKPAKHQKSDATWGTPPGRRGGVRSTLLQTTWGFHAPYIVKIHDFLTFMKFTNMHLDPPTLARCVLTFLPGRFTFLK